MRAGGVSKDLPPANPGNAADLAFISYTSGTTGHSKGIMYSNEMAISFGESNDWLLGYTRTDVAFTCLPLFHGNAVFCSLLPGLAAAP